MDRNRGTLIEFYEEIENIEENKEWKIEENGEDKVLVVENRGAYRSKIYLTSDELIEKILDYAFENRSIGFFFDW